MATYEPLLPTPTANEDMHERMKKKQNDGTNRHSLFLTDAISSPEASHANLSPKPDEEKERTMTAISGRRCYGLFENFGQHGSSVKMLRDYLLSSKAWYSNKCALTWKQKVTKFSRSLYQLSPSMRRTEETGSGLLPTNRARDFQKAEKPGARQTRGAHAGDDLPTVIAMLPTPRAADADKGTRTTEGVLAERARRKNGVDLPTFLKTPGASEGEGGVMEISEGTTGKYKMRDQVIHALGGKGTGLKLQPSFALWMMGYPTDWLDLEDGEMPLSKARATRGSRKLQSKSSEESERLVA
jgi:hypothetical protein